jgi:hypothetical protein
MLTYGMEYLGRMAWYHKKGCVRTTATIDQVYPDKDRADLRLGDLSKVQNVPIMPEDYVPGPTEEPPIEYCRVIPVESPQHPRKTAAGRELRQLFPATSVCDLMCQVSLLAKEAAIAMESEDYSEVVSKLEKALDIARQLRGLKNLDAR